MRRFYTIDDLYTFCKTNHFEKFSSIEQGAPLIVQSFGTFEATNNTDGLMTVKLKSCHTGKNRNQSGITDETMELYKDSFKGRPILGAIYKTDTGEYEFRAHDMEIVEDDNGEADIHYIEQPIGVISQIATPYLEFDNNAKKNYLMVEGTIFSDYSKAAEILERHRTCKCSVEIAVEEMSYNVAEDYLSIDKFHFTGVTILGYQQDGTTEIQEGMAGSKITIDDFSAKHNSMFATNYQDKMIEILDKLNTTLSNFNNNSKEKGCDKMGKFEELLQQYNVTAGDITFEIEGLSDEELEVKFKDAFEDNISTGDDSSVNEETENISTSENDDGEVSSSEFAHKKTYSVGEDGNMTVSFEISHEDIRGALYTLLEAYEQEDNEWYWITNVFDNYFVFENLDGNKLYKQSYAVDGDNVSLSGDRQEVFKMILTESEKLAIEKMREDYAALEAKYNELQAFKDNYDAAQVKAQKDAIFARDEYAALADEDAFKAVVADAGKYSVDEVESKVKAVFADYVIKTGEFSIKSDNTKKPKVLGFNLKNNDKEPKSPYGNLFSK